MTDLIITSYTIIMWATGSPNIDWLSAASGDDNLDDVVEAAVTSYNVMHPDAIDFADKKSFGYFVFEGRYKPVVVDNATNNRIKQQLNKQNKGI